MPGGGLVNVPSENVASSDVLVILTTEPAVDLKVLTQFERSALELVVGAVIAAVHKYLSYNVIPYVDVMLVLLVIFMVTAPFMIQGIDVELPNVESQPVKKANLENITISISSIGDFYLDLESTKNKPFSIVELKEELMKILNNNNAIEVYIRADKGVIFGEVAKLMSLLQELKPDSINFITEPIND